MFLFALFIFFIISFSIFYVVKCHINISSLEYPYYIIGFIRISTIFPALYIIHVINENIKYIKSIVENKVYSPDYSINGMNYSIFNLICSLVGFIVVTSFFYPYLNNLLIYYLTELSPEKSRITSAFKNNDFSITKEYPLNNTQGIQKFNIEKSASFEIKLSNKCSNIFVKYIVPFIKDNLKLLDFDFKNNYRYLN